jgi:hypothetical protein
MHIVDAVISLGFPFNIASFVRNWPILLMSLFLIYAILCSANNPVGLVVALETRCQSWSLILCRSTGTM